MAQRSSVNSVVRMGIGTPGGNQPCQDLTDTANMRQSQSCRPSVRPIATRKKACGSSPDNGANWPNKPSAASFRPQSLERPAAFNHRATMSVFGSSQHFGHENYS